jgi:hypothetical protein
MSALSFFNSSPSCPSPVAFLHVRSQRPDFYVHGMDRDLSSLSLACALAICILSWAHIKLWNEKNRGFWLSLVDLIRSIGAWISLVGLVLSTVPFAHWQIRKKQPQYAHQYEYILVPLVPWVYELSVEVSIHSFG